jgi:hypothetical protein
VRTEGRQCFTQGSKVCGFAGLCHWQQWRPGQSAAGRGTSVARGTAPGPAPRLLGAGEPGPVRSTGSGFKLQARGVLSPRAVRLGSRLRLPVPRQDDEDGPGPAGRPRRRAFGRPGTMDRALCPARGPGRGGPRSCQSSGCACAGRRPPRPLSGAAGASSCASGRRAHATAAPSPRCRPGPGRRRPAVPVAVPGCHCQWRRWPVPVAAGGSRDPQGSDGPGRVCGGGGPQWRPVYGPTATQ